MARNRKNQSASVRFGPWVKAALLCVAFAGSGLGYVWQKNQIYDLGQQMRRREAQLSDLQEQNDKFKRQLATLMSPRFLDQRVKDMKLGLVPPQPAQVWRLPEPMPEPQSIAPTAGPQYAAGQMAGLDAP